MKILLVEDNPITKDYLATILKRSGHEVISAVCGMETLEILRNGFHPDVVLVDMELPGMSGGTIVHKLIKEENHPPVLVISAGDKLPSLPSDIPYLRKPFDMVDLEKSLATLCPK